MTPTLANLRVDCAKEPEDRWSFTVEHTQRLRELARIYNRDMGVTNDVAELIETAAAEVLPDVYRRELVGIADQTGVPFREILAANFYYDTIKFACTAVAVDSEHGPTHARNLDWWTPGKLLSEATVVVEYLNARAGPFRVVGWPGQTGVLSGVAAGRFAISLNAVLSAEPGRTALPVVYLLRQVFEQAESYTEAVELLSATPIPSDCLLLVTGCAPGELVVIERTPTRHALRQPVDGVVWLTNDYRMIDANSGAPTGDLQETSCGRYERMGELLAERRPQSALDFFAYLSDSRVRMEITVQQMVFHARTGACDVVIP